MICCQVIIITQGDMMIIIIGAGPIGLMAALVCKLKHPEKTVRVVEKRENYTRSHNLRIKPEILKLYIKELEAINSGKDLTGVSQIFEEVRKSPSIAINHLQKSLGSVATSIGVEKVILEGGVTEGNYQQEILSHHPDLVLAADGVKGVIGPMHFGKDNQVVEDAGFVLNIRLNAKVSQSSHAKPTWLEKAENAIKRIQTISRTGVTFVQTFSMPKGSDDARISLLANISKEQHGALVRYSSGNPLKINGMSRIDGETRQFSEAALTVAIDNLKAKGFEVDTDSVELSVNKSPSTITKAVYNQGERCDGGLAQAPVCLLGDSALGLSYFMGLNAGIEQVCRFSKAVEAIGSDRMHEALSGYSGWFKTFSRKKKKAMHAHYNASISAPSRVVKWFSGLIYGRYDQLLLKGHYSYAIYAQQKGLSSDYPHRTLQPKVYGDYDITPGHVYKEMRKQFDLVSHIKSPFYYWKILGLNLFKSIANILIGLRRLLIPRSAKSAGVGGLVILLGLLQVVMYPIALLFLLGRSLVVAFKGFKKIEQNDGMKRLVALLDDSSTTTAAKMAICFDMKRKANKAFFKKQSFLEGRDMDSLNDAFAEVEEAERRNDQEGLQRTMTDFVSRLRA